MRLAGGSPQADLRPGRLPTTIFMYVHMCGTREDAPARARARARMKPLQNAGKTTTSTVLYVHSDVNPGSLGKAWGGLGEAWVGTGSELGRNWVGTGSEPGSELWIGTESELWVGTGWELRPN